MNDTAERMRNISGQFSRLAWELDEAERAYKAMANDAIARSLAEALMLHKRQECETFLTRHWRD